MEALPSQHLGDLGDGAATKGELRQQLRARRALLAAQDRNAADEGIARRLLDLPEFEGARLILTYLSVGDEVDTRRVIEEAWRQGKTVAVPRCVPGTRDMEWYEISSFDGLVKTRFGIEEPDPATARPLALSEALLGRKEASALSGGGDEPGDCARAGKGLLAMALVPGLAFDGQGRRLGYGGGYYDVFLGAFEGFSVGLCREGFLLDTLAPFDEAHDRRVDAVITQSRIFSQR